MPSFRELSQEEYNRLTPEQQTAYNQAKVQADAETAAYNEQVNKQNLNKAAYNVGNITIDNPSNEQQGLQVSSQRSASSSVNTANNESISSSKHKSTGEQHKDIDIEGARAAAAAEIEQRHKAQGDIWNEQTKQWEPATLGNALKIRDNLRAQREDLQRRNRAKELSSALFNSAALISDIASAGAGGNVWKRDKDTTLQDAVKDNERLRELQAAEDVAFEEQERKRRMEQAANDQAILDKWIDRKTKLVSSNSGSQQGSQRGSSVSRGNQSNVSVGRSFSKQASVWDDDYLSARYGGSGSRRSGRGGGKVKTIKIPYTDSDGKTKTVAIDIPEAHYDAMGSYISGALNRLRENGNNIDKVLEKSGIFPKEDGTYNTDDILAGGVIFEDPSFRAEFEREILGTDDLTPEGKVLLIQQMKTYPTNATEAEKKSWWRRFIDWISGDDEEESAGGFNPDGDEQPEGGL